MQFRMLVAAFLAASLAACGGGGGGTVAPQAQPPAKSMLAVAMSAPAEAVPSGTTTTLTLTIANAGPAAATDVVLAPNLAAGLTQGPATCVSAGTAICPAGPGLPLAFASVPAGGTLTFQLAVGVPEGASGNLTSTPVVATAGNNDALQADNVALAVIRAYTADVAVTASGPTQPVMAGGTASYRMIVSNSGPDDARQVSLVNALGESQALGAMSCTATGGATCPAPLGTNMTAPLLPRGGTLAFTVPSIVAANTTGTIRNVMTASAAGDPQAANNSGSAQASAYVVAPLTVTSITLRGDPGDYISGGRNYAYTQANAVIGATAVGNRFSLQVRGDQDWHADFVLPASQAQFAPGTYTNLQRYPFHDPAVGGIDWSGEGRGCNVQLGTITVNSVRYDAGQLSAIDLDFEQHCERSPLALRGHVVWVAGDPTAPPGPQNPPPAALWQPAVALPATGTYVYLEGESGDFVSQGRSALYTNADAILAIGMAGNRATVRVNGDQSWTGDFQGMSNLADLRPGYYGNLLRYQFHNPTRGGLTWSGEGRGCNYSTGWFVVDAVTYANGFLSSFDLRFEQHCEASPSAVRGKVHWEASDTTTPPGPVNPPPSGLWSPPAASLPASGNYVYLESDAGDYIGGGGAGSFPAFNVVPNGDFLSVSGGGWSGSFKTMNTLQRLQPGYYGILKRYPFHNPAKGGMSWSGQGRGCNTLWGWFVVDRVTYVGAAMTELDLRFEQHCDERTPALRGAIHWTQ